MHRVEIDIFTIEKRCSYRGEIYLARDNGAVFRCLRENGRKRQLDEVWTFGTTSEKSPYMMVNNHRVHQIVATAFHGNAPSKGHVVDHIDTNRRNNRPENLRWVTRLENIILNPITLKRIEYHYGSVEAFLADPGSPKTGELQPDFVWMRTVSKQEAQASLEKLRGWAQNDFGTKATGALGEWVFASRDNPLVSEVDTYVDAATAGAVQKNWKTPTVFPCCPNENLENKLEKYSNRVLFGESFSSNDFVETTVLSASMLIDRSKLFVLSYSAGGLKPWAIASIFQAGDYLVHENLGSFFQEAGAQQQFTELLGLPWLGEDSIDNYC